MELFEVLEGRQIFMLFLHSWEGVLGGHIRRVREARIASLRQTPESTPGYLAGEQPGPDLTLGCVTLGLRRVHTKPASTVPCLHLTLGLSYLLLTVDHICLVLPTDLKSKSNALPHLGRWPPRHWQAQKVKSFKFGQKC